MFPAKGKKAEIVKHVKETLVPDVVKEKGNLTYFWLQPADGSEDVIKIFEVYEDDNAITEHRKGKPLNALKEDTSLHGAPLSIAFMKPSSGFVSRSNDPKVENPLVLIATVTVKPGTRASVLEKFKELSDYVKATEPKTLSYLFNADVSDENKITVFERYADKAALEEIHFNSDTYKRVIGEISPNLDGSPALNFYENFAGYLYKGESGKY